MPDTHETISYILAEMRGNEFDDPHLDADGIIGARRLARDWADRIEAAVKREMDEAAEFIDDYLNEIPVYHPPHDWLIRNGYKDTSYQNDIFEDQNDGGAPAPGGAERDAKGETTP